MSGSIVLPVVTKYSDKGLRQARHGLGSFKKSIGGLKGALGGLGLALGAGQLVSFGREAAKAASADAKSQALLAATQKKSANATPKQIKQSEAFIQTLSNQVGVIDDNLRPSLASLTRSTGSVSQGQKLLKIALNASAATGKPLAATTAAVSKAFHGQTTALTRMFPELKNSKDALKALDDQTTGMAVLKADPFQKFTVGADNLKEKLGGLILPKLTDFMNTLMAPGGAMDQLSKFIDDAGNPKTDAGKAFKDIGDSMKGATSSINTFFGSFDPKKNDGVAGFLNVMNAVGGGVGFLGRVAQQMSIVPTAVAGGAVSAYQGIAGFFGGGKPSSKGRGKPQSMPMPSAQAAPLVVNVYGKATKTDAEEVLKLIREHERRNGTAWRK